MNTESKVGFIKAAMTLYTNDLRKYALHKIAQAQGPNDQEENALWCDFYECLQEAAKVSGVNLPDLTQEMVEGLKP